MSPDEFTLANVYRREIAMRVGYWARQAGIRLNQSPEHMTKGLMASLVTQIGREEEFWELPGVQRSDEIGGWAHFKRADHRSKRIPPIPPSVKAFLREAKKFDGLAIKRRTGRGTSEATKRKAAARITLAKVGRPEDET